MGMHRPGIPALDPPVRPPVRDGGGGGGGAPPSVVAAAAHAAQHGGAAASAASIAQQYLDAGSVTPRGSNPTRALWGQQDGNTSW